MGRQRRKCLYQRCGHNQGNNIHNCTFHSFPKDPAAARLWLSLGGVYDQTPKKLLNHWCFCSCHFPDGRKGNPVEFIEEYEDVVQLIVESPNSPAAKSRRVEFLSPSTKAAAEALILLPSAVLPPPVNEGPIVESSIGAESNRIIVKARRRTTPKYSPSRKLWSIRNKQVLQGTKQAFRQALDFEDLGVAILPEENLDDTPIDDNNNNVTSEDNETGDTSTPKTPYQKERCASCAAQIKETCSVGTQCDRPFLSYARCKLMSEEDFRFYTGISQELFEILYTFLGGDKVCCTLKYEYKRKTPRKINSQGQMCAKDNLFMTLLRLRRGIPLRDIKILFKLSISQVSKIFYTWIRFMSLEFQKLQDVMFIPAKCQEKLKPVCFEPFKNLRVIIDCTEFKIQQPKHMKQNSNTFSEYKSYNSIKFLFGISCFGGLFFYE